MPRRFLPLLASLILLVPALARGEGLNLAWTNCANGSGAIDNFTSSCEDESQTATLVGSFLAPAGVDSFLAMEASLTIVADGKSIPDFWQIGDEGCRPSAASVGFSSSGLSGCSNPWGNQVLGLWDFSTLNQPPGKPLILIVAARTKAAQLSSGREYLAFRLDIGMEGGTGCQGCRDGACIVLNSMILRQPAEMYRDAVITTAAYRNYVTWQGGGAACPGAKASQKVTWGQVKAHYR